MQRISAGRRDLVQIFLDRLAAIFGLVPIFRFWIHLGSFQIQEPSGTGKGFGTHDHQCKTGS